MTPEAIQTSLFQDPLGLRIKQAREKAQLSREQVAQRLKLPLAIIEAVEREDWARLGAPVYVRSMVGGYLKLLGLPASLADAAASRAQPPVLAAMDSSSRVQGTLDRTIRNVVYLAMTGVIVVPIAWLAMHFERPSTPVAPLTLEPQIQDSIAPSPGPAGTQAPAAGDINGAASGPQPVSLPEAPAEAAQDRPPVVASLAPFASSPKAVPVVGAELRISFRGESWLEVLGADGQRLERGLVSAGSERRYAPGDVARITVGNADAVEVIQAGRALDLAPFRTANVARFAVSSANNVAPAVD